MHSIRTLAENLHRAAADFAEHDIHSSIHPFIHECIMVGALQTMHWQNERFDAFIFTEQNTWQDHASRITPRTSEARP